MSVLSKHIAIKVPDYSVIITQPWDYKPSYLSGFRDPSNPASESNIFPLIKVVFSQSKHNFLHYRGESIFHVLYVTLYF